MLFLCLVFVLFAYEIVSLSFSSRFHMFPCFKKKEYSRTCNEAAAQRISAYTSAVLRKVCSLPSKSSSLFVTVLLSVNRNFSPRAIPRSSSSRTFLASRLARECTRPRASGPSVFSILLPPSSAPFHPFRGDRGAELDK